MFITFEGIEGAGKSSVMTTVETTLTRQGRTVLRTREPGGSPLGRELRRILLDVSNSDLSTQAEMFLYLADRAQHVARVIAPALQQGTVVLSDRYADSTIVYQGYGRGLDTQMLQMVNDIAVSSLWPDITLLFDLPAEQGLQRAMSRNSREGTTQTEGRFEAESLEFHKRVRQGYLTRAALYKNRFHCIDAVRPLDEVTAQALKIISQHLNTR